MSLWICLRWPEGLIPPDSDAAMHRLALAMLHYSPNVACFREDSVVLEVAASLSLFGGIRRLCHLVRRTASDLMQAFRLGVAPSATGAWLLAGSPAGIRRRVLRVNSLARNLAALPLHHLPEARPHLQWLQNIGCRRLESLRKLPRQGLQQRSSPALLQALDAAYAQAPETLAWLVPPGRFQLAYEPDIRLERAEIILLAAQPLLQALCGWLHSRQEALHDVVLILHHEKGRKACAPTRVALRFSTAAWKIEDFNLLLKERLQHCVLQQAAIKLEILADAPQPRAPANDTLFPDPSRHRLEERRLLDLLAARLGPTGIRRPRPAAQHLPERANVWAISPEPPSREALPTTLADKPRPFWLLAQALPLNLHGERPLHQGRPLRLVQGPERIETGWYADEHQRRDYFVAEDPDGARYWIYRERETGDGWFLHGLFA
ncbi:MAG TPA: DNA polymerase Y family protein [Burkholderiaceae bacterium]|jgi:protein ImuB|nr:DNA polymerase Y family protein [Burkholderiaceae bacterium]